MQTAHSRVPSLTDNESRATVERVICFRVTQTVAARNKRSTPLQRIVTRIILDISRCPHRPVVNKFYCPAPYFYLPRDVGTCLSLSPDIASHFCHMLSIQEYRMVGRKRWLQKCNTFLWFPSDCIVSLTFAFSRCLQVC